MHSNAFEASSTPDQGLTSLRAFSSACTTTPDVSTYISSGPTRLGSRRKRREKGWQRYAGYRGSSIAVGYLGLVNSEKNIQPGPAHTWLQSRPQGNDRPRVEASYAPT